MKISTLLKLDNCVMKRGISLTTSIAISALIIFSSALITSCSKEKPKPSKVKVSIRSVPDKVDVRIISHGRAKFGTTPKTQSLPPGTYVLEFTKPGFKTTWKKLICLKGRNEEFEVKMEPVSSSVIIESQPAAATILKNDTPIGETPLAIHNLPLGVHSYVISKPGYSTRTVDFKLDDARPKLIEVNMNSNVGTLVIRSTPTDANIYVNDAPRGQTPASLTLEQGEYNVKLELNGYEPQQEKVIVSRGKTVRMNTKLQVKPGSIEVITYPSGASLIVNGKQYNNTPTTLKNLKPGTYAIKVSHANYDSSSREVTIQPGQSRKVSITLDTNMGGIDLIVHPPGVTIYVDGKKLGKTERGETENLSKVFQVRNLASGIHTITVAHKRATPPEKNFKINIKKGKISRPKPYTFWVKDTYLKLKNGQEITGRVSQENEDEVYFEHSPKIKIRYERNEIETIRKLKDGE